MAPRVTVEALFDARRRGKKGLKSSRDKNASQGKNRASGGGRGDKSQPAM